VSRNAREASDFGKPEVVGEPARMRGSTRVPIYQPAFTMAATIAQRRITQ
jgi:hypothetical protein